ncbi:MAG: hypothetical protein ABSA14_15345 [Acidimicrobiales bacterium]
MTRYASLAEYYRLAEQVTGIEAGALIEASPVELTDSALRAPQAGWEDKGLTSTSLTKPPSSHVGSLGTIPCRMATNGGVGHPRRVPRPQRRALEPASSDLGSARRVITVLSSY